MSEQCKICKHDLLSSDSYAQQGYCNGCANQFTRHKNAVTPRAAPREKAVAPKAAPPKAEKTHPRKRQGGKRTCNRCGDFGHIAVDCRTKICAFCHARGHVKERCFSDPNNCCEKCGTYGHAIEDCRLCERCGDFGHAMDDCRTKICDECGKRGHLSEKCWYNKVCERCGVTGHIAQACRTKIWCPDCEKPHPKCEAKTTEKEI